MGATIGEKANARLREEVRKIIDERYGGKLARAAGPFGYAQGSLSDFMNEKRGGGGKLIYALQKHDPAAVLRVFDFESSPIEIARGYVMADDKHLDDHTLEAAVALARKRERGELSVLGWADLIRKLVVEVRSLEAKQEAEERAPPSATDVFAAGEAKPERRRRRSGGE